MKNATGDELVTCVVTARQRLHNELRLLSWPALVKDLGNQGLGLLRRPAGRAILAAKHQQKAMAFRKLSTKKFQSLTACGGMI